MEEIIIIVEQNIPTIFFSLLDILFFNALGLAKIRLHLSHFLSHLVDGGNLLLQHRLEIAEVVLDIAADFVCLSHQEHLLLHQLY